MNRSEIKTNRVFYTNKFTYRKLKISALMFKYHNKNIYIVCSNNRREESDAH